MNAAAENKTELRQALRHAGFSPIPVEGKIPAPKAWQQKVNCNAEEIASWSRFFPEAASTGILTRATPTIDIDILNPEAAEAIEALARERFEERGYFLVRIGQAPKRAIPLRTDAPFKKIVGNVIAPDGSEQKIELLGDGQQVVVFGIHPSTGKPYSWHGGEPGAVRWEDLPYVSTSEAKAFVDDAVRLLVEEHGYKAATARPKERAKGNGAEIPHSGADWAWLIANIRDGRELHDSTCALAAKLLAAGMNDAAAVNVIRGAMESSTVPHDERWQARWGDVPRAVASARRKFGDGAGMSQGPEGLRENPQPAEPPPFVFNPEPYDPPDPASIPKREWLYGRHYLRGIVSASLGAPGRLKSTTSMTELIGMAAGCDLLTGNPLEAGPLRVAYLNGEENQDELDRRFAAICQHYRVTKQDCGGRIWVISTRDNPIRLAIPGPKGAAVVAEGVVEAMLTWCNARSIDVLAVDPLISFHRVRENDSGDMDLLFKEAFGAIAGKNRSVDLVVHPRKPAPGEINTTIDDLRGSSAQHGAVRTARTFNFMTTVEAVQLGIEENHRRLHVRIENGKGGPGPLGKANWVKIEVENLPNGDQVAVAVAWNPPDHFADVTVAHMEAVRNWGITGEFRVDSRSPKWLGWKVAELLGLKARHGGDNTKADLAKINKLLNTWCHNKVLDIAKRPDEKSRDREFYIGGSAAPHPYTNGSNTVGY
jgi:AAA domain/Bifunctional DNA primase/polymerase, N-terminal